MTLLQRSIAEAIGTFWLVFGGCGAAVLACGVPNTGIGYVGVSLAFGLTVLTMAYAIGHISGCHLNPAVTLGQVAGGRFPAKEAPAYIIAQVIGGIIAAAVLYIIASPDLSAGIGAFATNGWSDMANANGLNAFGGKVFGMGSAFLIEMVLTAVFLFVIMGATDGRAPAGFAPIAIGLCLTLIHLIGIPATNTSVNPARSTAVAVFVGGMALKQLWLFWVAPILGGVIGGVAYKVLAEKKCCCGDKCCCEKKEEA
ncbi:MULTISPECIES: aquaporin Z [Hallerella]|uniref:aquaporin Z n=1 Tax=Hallerella TaxID=2815788 RepID=UPI002587C7BB|nr:MULTISPECIES: aquaporin Z [Hallerella]MCI6872929.1 aquaporin Z [Hallerella sp.]MDY5030214.1 aquaporin Z [Hallerella succinigenes]